MAKGPGLFGSLFGRKKNVSVSTELRGSIGKIPQKDGYQRSETYLKLPE